MKDKKGVELSMNLIIIAAIALLVLVIIAVLVLRSSGNIVEGTNCAAKQGGHCIAKDTSCADGETSFPATCPTDQKCCITTPV